MTKKILFLVILLFSSLSFAEVQDVNINRTNSPESRLGGLSLNGEDYKTAIEEHEGKAREFVIIKGKFSKPQFHLVYEGEKIKTSETGDVEIKIPVEPHSSTVVVPFRVVGPLGEVQEEKVTFGIIHRIQIPEDPSRIYFTPEAGVSWISYRETSKTDYSEFALTLKASARRQIFNPSWDIASNAFFTAFPLNQNYAASARFLGVNFRLGYTLPLIQAPWKVSLHGGWYYTTMRVAQNQFGFTNMAGPQIFSVIQRTLKSNDIARGYIKISPVSSSATSSLWSFKNRELALGGAYVHFLPNGHTLLATIDWARFDIVFPRQTIQVNSLTIGAGYGL
jgi:hypothetical protein